MSNKFSSHSLNFPWFSFHSIRFIPVLNGSPNDRWSISWSNDEIDVDGAGDGDDDMTIGFGMTTISFHGTNTVRLMGWNGFRWNCNVTAPPPLTNMSNLKIHKNMFQIILKTKPSSWYSKTLVINTDKFVTEKF